MRDYYTAYVSARVEKNQKCSDREGAKGAEGAFAPSVYYEYPENFPLELPESALNEDGPGTDTFQERVAIMMYDGGLTEVEAVRFLTQKKERDVHAPRLRRVPYS